MMSAESTWGGALSRRLVVVDVITVIVTIIGTQVLWYGLNKPLSYQLPGWPEDKTAQMPFAIPGALLGVAWLFSLWAYKTRETRVLGAGAAEYKRVADATIRIFGGFAIIAFILNFSIGQGFLLTGLPAAVMLLLAARWGCRQWLIHNRLRGKYQTRAVLFGERDASQVVARQIEREPGGPITVVGALLPDAPAGAQGLTSRVPVLGSLDEARSALIQARADSLIMVGADGFGAREMRELGWMLADIDVPLIVSPSMTDIAGPRIHSSPVAGLPLIHVDFPDVSGPKLWVKRTVDFISAACALALVSPVFAAIAIAIRVDSPGPVIFRQRRIGLNGVPFTMLKFRSMVVDAEEQLPSLLDQSEGNGVMFKLKADPRITRVGRFLRQYSLDELPQLVNVLRGQMSLVGPRPPLPEEVERYDHWAERRLLVKPGVTGLWQVSGRSNLDWEDTIRLDLYYVENWSLTSDLTIAFRTVVAVLKRHGAY